MNKTFFQNIIFGSIFISSLIITTTYSIAEANYEDNTLYIYSSTTQKNFFNYVFPEKTLDLSVNLEPSTQLYIAPSESQVYTPTNTTAYIGIIPSGIPLLVNKQYGLQSDFIPQDLVMPNVSFASSGDIEKNYMTVISAEALESMFKAAQMDNIYLYAVSGYRSYIRQETIYNSNVKIKGQAETDRVSAKPGNSEHQTGLAMDISSKSNGLDLTTNFENTKEGQWLKNNAHNFGFILRYPKEKEDITGYSFEPWHFRYVGTEIATFIYNNDLTLEEYVEIKQSGAF